MTVASSSTNQSHFLIPVALHDLEREPYHLLPYPQDFDDDNEGARADSFDRLVDLLDNHVLRSSTMVLFVEGDDEAWLNEERMQALYTLVRKSSSIAHQTKKQLVERLTETMDLLSELLTKHANSHNQGVVSSEFRIAFGFHLYMLYSLLTFMEQEAKSNNTMDTNNNKKQQDQDEQLLRTHCAQSMHTATVASARCTTVLWQRGVADPATALLPCRIAYLLLETARGAKRAACAQFALQMLQESLQAHASVALSHVVPALMDLLHTHEHMAPLVAQLGLQNHTLTVQLLQEVGRLQGTNAKQTTGIRNVAPFLVEVAQTQPKVVLSQLPHLLHHLDQEPYYLRSALCTSLAYVIVTLQEPEQYKSRHDLLTLLQQRVLDTSSFTRGAVLKAFITIVEQQALPTDALIQTTALAADRLQDKTVLVRRAAMQLLTTLLEHNPFLGSLDPKPYKNKLAELQQKLLETMPQQLRDAQQEALDAEPEARQQIQQATVAAALAEDADDADFKSTVQAIKFTQLALDFIDQYEYAKDACQGMLLSKNTSDVTEALRFFVRARHFGLPCAVSGMKQALTLMWSSEQSVRDEVLQTFVQVFVHQPGTDECLPDNQIAHNLLVLVGRASVSELASIEEALGRLVKTESIPPDVFLILWSIASKASAEARAAALVVLAMAASTDRSIVDSASRLRLLVDAGLGDAVEEARDFNTVRSAASVLQRISIADLDPTSAKAIVLEHVIERLCVVIRGDWCVTEQDTLSWFSAAEQSIDALFGISQQPEDECAEIIRSMAITIFGIDCQATTCHSLRLARFFFVLGHVALKLLVHTEYLSGAIRRGNAKKSLKKQEQADNNKRRDEDAIEDELGVAAEAEAENERRFNDISEKEILGRGLISKFTPLLVRVVGNEGGKFQSSLLRQSATLALCKFMCISMSFCEDHLPLVFTALSNAPEKDTTLRANTVIAMGDHAFRFPNEVEPYTPRVYACLRDSSTKVRRHTLMVLTHLILNDMVKVKGQVCEIAMCLRDDDSRIRDMSRLLFFELSKRTNNPIYNLLPDIISQLSQQDISKEDFRSIMSFLLAFIKKERQNEMLVEKLLHRFPKCQTISQKADLAFCIAQLKINEKSVKCLTDLFRLYKDALFDEEVKKSFFSIVSKAKKFAKPEMRQCLDDWEAKLKDHSILGQENQAVGQQAAKAKTKAAKRARKTRRKVMEDVDELSFIEEEEATNKENTVESQ